MLHVVMQICGCVGLSPGSWVVLHVVMLPINTRSWKNHLALKELDHAIV